MDQYKGPDIGVYVWAQWHAAGANLQAWVSWWRQLHSRGRTGVAVYSTKRTLDCKPDGHNT